MPWCAPRPMTSSYGRRWPSFTGTVVMLNGRLQIRGLKIPCGASSGTRLPSKTKPRCSSRRSNRSGGIFRRSSRNAKATRRTRRSASSTPRFYWLRRSSRVSSGRRGKNVQPVHLLATSNRWAGAVLRPPICAPVELKPDALELLAAGSATITAGSRGFHFRFFSPTAQREGHFQGLPILKGFL